jgi:hypothetical protein
MDQSVDLSTGSYLTPAGVRVHRAAEPFDPAVLGDITRQVQDRPGGVLSSGMEYPGRYSRWHMAYVDPPIQVVARGRRVSVTALNERGLVLLPVLEAALRRAGTPPQSPQQAAGDPARQVEIIVEEEEGVFAEEDRSRRPTVFSAVREIIAALAGPDPHLACTGRSAMTSRSSSSRSGCASSARRPAAIWSCTCPIGSGCWIASARSRLASATTSSRRTAPAPEPSPGSRPARQTTAAGDATSFPA